MTEKIKFPFVPRVRVEGDPINDLVAPTLKTPEFTCQFKNIVIEPKVEFTAFEKAWRLHAAEEMWKRQEKIMMASMFAGTGLGEPRPSESEAWANPPPKTADDILADISRAMDHARGDGVITARPVTDPVTGKKVYRV